MSDIPPIETPRDLYEIKRYEDVSRGAVLELIPVNPILTRTYIGEVLVNGRHTIKFRLPGTSLTQALAGWEQALRAVFEHMAAQRMREQIIAGAPARPRVISG